MGISAEKSTGSVYLVKSVPSGTMSELNYHIGMQEVRGNHVRDKRCAFILEDDGHNIIANVTLTLKLERSRGKGKK